MAKVNSYFIPFATLCELLHFNDPKKVKTKDWKSKFGLSSDRNGGLSLFTCVAVQIRIMQNNSHELLLLCEYVPNTCSEVQPSAGASMDFSRETTGQICSLFLLTGSFLWDALRAVCQSSPLHSRKSHDFWFICQLI